jgi:hypothetical protein
LAAAALVLVPMVVFFRAMGHALLPLWQWGFEWLAPEFKLHQMQMGATGHDLHVVVSLARALPIGDIVVLPAGRADASTGIAFSLLGPALVLLICCAWPARRGWEKPLRLLLAAPAVLLLTALDAPAALASVLWQLLLDSQGQHAGAATPTVAVVAWAHFLAGGGRVLMAGLAAAAIVAIAASLRRPGPTSTP